MKIPNPQAYIAEARHAKGNWTPLRSGILAHDPLGWLGTLRELATRHGATNHSSHAPLVSVACRGKGKSSETNIRSCHQRDLHEPGSQVRPGVYGPRYKPSVHMMLATSTPSLI
jgi:hypothetical protein